MEFKLSKATLRIILSSLTACLTNAQREDGLIPANNGVALGRFITQAKPRHESIDPFRPEEVPVFLQAVREVAPDFLTMFTVLIHTGLRSGECAALKRGDVDFRNRYVLVRRSWNRKGEEGDTKNKKHRRVDLSDAAIAPLKAHKARLQAKYLKEGEPLPQWVFPNGEGKPHNMTNVRNRVFHAACRKAGLLAQRRAVDLEYSGSGAQRGWQLSDCVTSPKGEPRTDPTARQLPRDVRR